MDEESRKNLGSGDRKKAICPRKYEWMKNLGKIWAAVVGRKLYARKMQN